MAYRPPKRRLRGTAVCSRKASLALTYVYCDAEVVIDPLSPTSEPYFLDLCSEQALALVAPEGWRKVRRNPGS